MVDDDAMLDAMMEEFEHEELRGSFQESLLDECFNEFENEV